MESFNEHEDRIEALAVSPNQKLIATGSHDKTIKIWDAVSSE
jgi:WD40 repeat protein